MNVSASMANLRRRGKSEWASPTLLTESAADSTFNDKPRVVPKGKKNTYNKDFEGEVKEIKGEEWKSNVDGNGIEEGLKGDTTRKHIYNFAVKNAPDNAPFVYLSLIALVDAVDCVARIWGKIVKD